MFLFITICFTDFYLFVLCSSLLIYSLSHVVLALAVLLGPGLSWHCMWYRYHAIALR